MENRTGKSFALYVSLALPVLLLGAIEGWYQRTFYTTDAISYLDVSRAISAHEWKYAVNPLWSSGYPALIAFARHFFPQSSQGEWAAIHALNLVILLFSFATFLYLLKSFEPQLQNDEDDGWLSTPRFLLLAGYCIFLCTELCINGASRVSPDPLVDALFFAAMGTLIRLIQDPRWYVAAQLGVILGIGYLVKTIFLPVSAIILLIAAVALHRGARRMHLAVVSGAVFLLFFIPYVAGLSWSFGRFTMGESGALNYAWHVNLLPRYTNWQGGPDGYGMPIHPSRLLLKSPQLFEFAQPFHDTYPPFAHAPYWYQGYRHFWSLKYQAVGLGRNLYYLVLILIKQPITYAIVATMLAFGFRAQERRAWLAHIALYWPLFVPPLLGIAMYAWVHLEDRYLAGFLATLGLLPFLSLCTSQRQLSRRVRTRILAVLALATVASFAVKDRVAFVRAFRGQSYLQDPEWKLAAYLRQTGLKPADKVGAIGGPNAECTWAYADGLRIVAELGGGPYDPHPSGRQHWWSNRREEVADSGADEFWASSPDMQAKILALFKQAGAIAIIAGSKPSNRNATGWVQAPGLDTWVYRF